LARLSAHDFVSLLKKHLRVKGLVVGPDFTLGYAKEGDIDTLRKLGRVMDFTVTVVPPVTIDDQVVSSTSIRASLARGNLKKVCKLIGRPFRLHGRVIAGASRGAKLGFPTANLEVDPEQALPAEGVYASQTYIDGEAHKSMTYIGKNPTFGGQQCTVEIYILDYEGNLYGSQLEVDLIERLRGEQQFATAEELKQQISQDVKQGREILNFRDKG
jgi:riboflavin kinase/FMN adenylyltransferase